VDISGIFFSINLATKVGCYTGLIESLDMKIDKLSGTHFEAGIRSMEQAINSESEQISLFRESRSNFNRAISLEKNERLAMTYIGLAFCHNQLGDYDNAVDSLKMIARIEVEEDGKAVLKVGLFLALGPLGSVLLDLEVNIRLNKIKEAVQCFLNNNMKQDLMISNK